MFPGNDPFAPHGAGDPFGPPPGAGQPYGSPYGQPPIGPPRRNRTPLVLAAIAVAVLLIGAGVWFATRDSGSSSSGGETSVATAQVTTDDATVATTPSVVTSVITPTTSARVKLDLADVREGTCVRIQIRSAASPDALDLFAVDCAEQTGIYTVTERVATNDQCHSVYVAAPPDHAFALCLDPYRG